ncbi:MAG: hypothetical protein D6798_15415, partial [Deltaproteobacteria bacterium]
MWLLLPLLACTPAPVDDDSGEGGARTDGGAHDAGAGDGGAVDGGGADSGAPGCDTRAWWSAPEVRLEHQAEVDAFCTRYNAVDGDLVVDVGADEDPITQLDGIGCLCEVSGSLTITGDGDT